MSKALTGTVGPLLALMTWLALLDVSVAEGGSHNLAGSAPTCVTSQALVAEHRFRDYRVKVFEDTRDAAGSYGGCVEIWKGGTRIHSVGDEGSIDRYRVAGWPVVGDTRGPLALGKDVTGDGAPDLVLMGFRGGSCCVWIEVFEIGRRFRVLGGLNLGRADHSYFSDVNGDGKPEFLTWDGTFTCWRACCACSAAPQVVLRFQEGDFRLATDLMRKPEPSRADLEVRARQIGRAPRDGRFGVPVALWREMLDLIYGGNAPAARELFQLAWPADLQGRDRFLLDFQAQLRTSPYWKDLEAVNGGRVW